jgi:hypothetical protein
LKEEVQRMVDLGVMRKVNRSEWAFPAFTVPKFEGHRNRLICWGPGDGCSGDASGLKNVVLDVTDSGAAENVVVLLVVIRRPCAMTLGSGVLPVAEVFLKFAATVGDEADES